MKLLRRINKIYKLLFSFEGYHYKMNFKFEITLLFKKIILYIYKRDCRGSNKDVTKFNIFKIFILTL